MTREIKAHKEIKIAGDQIMLVKLLSISLIAGTNEPKITVKPADNPILDTRQFFDTCGTIIAGDSAQVMPVNIANIKYPNII